MKDIKTFLIGFLTCCCMFLIMGQTDAKHHWQFAFDRNPVDVDFTYFLINTKTSELKSVVNFKKDDGGRMWIKNPMLDDFFLSIKIQSEEEKWDKMMHGN